MAYAPVQKIAALRLKLHKVLPAMYDESLSYLEALMKLLYKINEIGEAVNALNDNVEALNDTVNDHERRIAYLENEIATFEARILDKFAVLEQAINESVDAKLAEMDGKMADMESRTDAKLAEMDRAMQEFRDYMTAELNRVTAELTAMVNEAIANMNARFRTLEREMREYVKNAIEEALAKIPEITSVWVIDPSDGKLEPIQECLQHMFNFSMYNALTVEEHNFIDMTIEEWSKVIVDSVPRGMTIYEMLHDCKPILLEQLPPEKAAIIAYPHCIVRDYLTGKKVWHTRNTDINWAMWNVSGCYNCDELASLEFTIDEFMEFAITCEDWTNKGNTIAVRTA